MELSMALDYPEELHAGFSEESSLAKYKTHRNF